MARPQKYPKASTKYWFSGRYPGSTMNTNVVVWHSTEGTSLPTYNGGSIAPNITAVPDFKNKRMIWYQHFNIDESARALANRSGGVETNTLNVAQVEVVGTCDPRTHEKWKKAGYAHLYMADLPDWAIRDLAAFAKWMNTEHQVPLTSGVTFKAYPSSYGSNEVRMSGSKWNNFNGHCGHQHVPENDHGDPGKFPMSRILEVAKGGKIEEEEDDPMAGMSDAEIADAVLNTDNVFGVPAHWRKENPKNDKWKFSAVIVNMGDHVRNIEAQLTAQQKTIEKLVDTIGNLSDLDMSELRQELLDTINSIKISIHGE